jgi:hypothetical protein
MIFLICPVRGIDKQTKSDIAAYVAKLEVAGTKVYWPLRDTNQDGDTIGNRICTDNRAALSMASSVHVWWSSGSLGTLFDLGMAWALNKPLVLANEVTPTEHKSFQNLVRWWCGADN